MTRSIHLGVNIDHVATLRQTRGTPYPNPVQAALIAEESGADNITMHLREDRRHIQDRDVVLVKETIAIPLNLEMAPTEEMLDFAVHLLPSHSCLVPERREELTTEGGLDVVSHENNISEACVKLATAGISTSLFIEPYETQIDAAARCGAQAVELHTGSYANAETDQQWKEHMDNIIESVYHAHNAGLTVNAGHGLSYYNVEPIAQLGLLHTLNIGHSIVSRALMTGFKEAVRNMKEIISRA